MLGHRELTMQDFAAILKRRLWLVLLSTVALFAIAIVLSYIIPPRFQSQTLVTTFPSARSYQELPTIPLAAGIAPDNIMLCPTAVTVGTCA